MRLDGSVRAPPREARHLSRLCRQGTLAGRLRHVEDRRQRDPETCCARQSTISATLPWPPGPARLPKHRQSSLSFIIARDSLPLLAAAPMRPSRRSYVRRRMIQGALETRCELSAASFPSITVPVARQRHSARMHGLILSRVVRQDQLRRIFEDPSSRLDKSTGSPIPTSFGFT